MAKASVMVTCSVCGKTYTATKTCYNRREADNWESWVVNQNDHFCTECYAEKMRVKREQERASEAEKNAKLAEKCTISLPELVGSEKQVKWANDIRTKFIAKLSGRGLKWEALASGDYPENEREAIEAELRKLKNASAKYWIEVRGQKIFGLSVDY